MKFQNYTTRLEYGRHPAGTPCKAKRELDKIILSFYDGTEVHLPGDKYWLPELEPKYSIRDDILGIMLQKSKDELLAVEDAYLFKAHEYLSEGEALELDLKELDDNQPGWDKESREAGKQAAIDSGMAPELISKIYDR